MNFDHSADRERRDVRNLEMLKTMSRATSFGLIIITTKWVFYRHTINKAFLNQKVAKSQHKIILKGYTKE